ncbi:hypothetical protein [Leptothoe spongobia]|uniref:hypothetical protein n=1 Tax=Leptothoe spongobia TaxID=2651728 RepID=UPI001C01EC6E|nr:hypothetical protein [Leptothoe spongobia]
MSCSYAPKENAGGYGEMMEALRSLCYQYSHQNQLLFATPPISTKPNQSPQNEVGQFLTAPLMQIMNLFSTTDYDAKRIFK